MNKKLLNLTLFSAVIIFIISLPIICVDRYLPQSQNPWQLQPFNADSLSHYYKNNYQILDDTALADFLDDTSKTTVIVMVDGWGVPYNETLLKQDFAIFRDNSTKPAIHKRLFNTTSYAEKKEFQKSFINSTFIYGGDSSSCSKKKKKLSHFFTQIDCCDNCSDMGMTALLDSLISANSWNTIAWTTRQTSQGDRDSLHIVLRELSKIAKKHTNTQFIIQGTHRPILGSPETRRKYLAPWIPSIFVNIKNIQ